jgi:hypothetical protein
MSGQITDTNIGAVSTAVTSYMITTNLQSREQFAYVSTFNGQNPTTPYKFKSESERILFMMGNINANCSIRR